MEYFKHSKFYMNDYIPKYIKIDIDVCTELTIDAFRVWTDSITYRHPEQKIETEKYGFIIRTWIYSHSDRYHTINLEIDGHSIGYIDVVFSRQISIQRVVFHA